MEEKEVDIATGKAVKILGTSADTMYVTIDDEVDYKELELEVLKFLDKSQENGKELSIIYIHIVPSISILDGSFVPLQSELNSHHILLHLHRRDIVFI